VRKIKNIPLFLLALIILALPLILFGIKQTIDGRSRAASADKLETESRVLAGNVVSKQDSLASGASYIELGLNQATQTNGIYGPGINIDSKNNNIIGGSNNAKLSHKFKASTT